MDADPKLEIPAHVRPEQVIDFDLYTEKDLFEDLHLGYKKLHALPEDILYTPRNGGHWIVTRFDLQSQILRDTEHFSNRELQIPKTNTPNVMIPLNLDPPDHARYRAVLMRHFDKKSVAGMEDNITGWANRLIDRVIAKGHADFAEELGAAFPVSVFMELMGLPLDRFNEFRDVVTEYFGHSTPARRVEIEGIIYGFNKELYEDRRRQPRDDLASKLLTEEVRGQKLTQDELDSIAFLLFIAGLDTVANALTFAFRNLALSPALQAELAANPDKIPAFVEESLRRFAVVNQTRVVKQDVEIAGARFRAGEMVMCPLGLAGMDERKNPEPENFILDRPTRAHITFSIGPHTCIGNILARSEMRVFTQEWLKRIPNFHVAPGTKFAWRPASVMSLRHLPLEWEKPTA